MEPIDNVPIVVIFVVPAHEVNAVFSTLLRASNVLVSVTVKAFGATGLPVLFPMILLAGRFAILVRVTAEVPRTVRLADPGHVVSAMFSTFDNPTSAAVREDHAGTEPIPIDFRTPAVEASLANVLGPEAYSISPVDHEFCPVPPYVVPITAPCHVPVPIVPTVVMLVDPTHDDAPDQLVALPTVIPA